MTQPEQSHSHKFGERPPLGMLNRGERVMWVLAKLAIEVLDAEREETGVDEWDESDTRCYLYNAAYAVLEHRAQDALDYEDDLGTSVTMIDRTYGHWAHDSESHLRTLLAAREPEARERENG